MKKVVLFTMMVVFFAVCAFAQEDASAPAFAVPPKQKSIEELQWQAKALQNEYNYLQERGKMIQLEFQAVQAEIKKRTPTPAPKPVEKPKDEPAKKK